MPKFITLADRYQDLFQEESEKIFLKERHDHEESGSIRFISHPKMFIFISKMELIAHPNFDNIISSEKSDIEKIEDFKKMALDMAREKIAKIQEVDPAITIIYSNAELQELMQMHNIDFEELLRFGAE